MQNFVRDSARNARLDHRFYLRACSHARFRSQWGRRTAPALRALIVAAVTVLIPMVGGVSAEAAVLHFQSPLAGATVKGDVRLAVVASEQVDSVAFYVDSVHVGSAAVIAGRHTIKATGYDSASKIMAEASTVVRIRNRQCEEGCRTPTPKATLTRTPTATPTPTPTPTISVSSLTLVDTDTNQPISPFNPIANGATINRATLPTQNLTIQANTTPSTVGSVVFDLVEAKYLNTVNTSPYDLCGPVPCSNLGVGLHSLTTTPYTGSNGSGGAGTSKSISFSLIDPTPTPTPAPTPTLSPTPTPTVQTTTLTLTSANNGQTFTNYRISTTSGPCVVINGATNITISNSNIGPCGQNNSDNDSTGIEMSGGSGINIYDSYIHVENLAATNSYSQTHSHSNIEAAGRGGSSPTTNVTIQGNVICFGAANIRTNNGSNGWTVNGNFLCNPRARDGSGNDFQAGDSYGHLIENNYMYGCIRPADASTSPYSSATSAMPVCPAAFNSFYSVDLEDTINFFYSAPQTNKSGTVNNNYMFGEFPGPASVAIDGSVANYKGSCIETDQNSHAVTAANNTLLESVGLVHDSGDGGFTATNNTVWSNNAPNPQIVAAVDTNGGSVANFGPCVWTGNILATHGGTNDNNYYWGGVSPHCSSLPGYVFSGNTVGAAADTALGLNSSMSAAQVAAIIPPPLIPPLPKNCVVKSPFSTQTSMAACP